MFRSVCAAIVRAALSETFDVSDGENAQALDRVVAWRCARARSGRTAATGRSRGTQRPEAVRSATSRCSCTSCARSTGSVAAEERRLVVVALDRGSGPSVEQGARALSEQRADVRGSAVLPAAHEQDLLDVPFGERALARRDLDDGRAVLGAPGRPDRDGGAGGRDQREREEDRDDRAPGVRRERPEGTRARMASSGDHHGVHAAHVMAGHVAEEGRSAPERGARAVRGRSPASPGSSVPTIDDLSASSLIVMPSERKRRPSPCSRTTISSCASGPLFRA